MANNYGYVFVLCARVILARILLSEIMFTFEFRARKNELLKMTVLLTLTLLYTCTDDNETGLRLSHIIPAARIELTS